MRRTAKRSIAERRLLEPAKGVCPNRLFGLRLKMTVAICATAIPVAALMPVRVAAQSRPPAPVQATPQSPPPESAQTPDQPPQSVMRTVTVTFNYDFSKFPPCSAKVTKKCVQQFNVYEVSGNKPIFLFSIPVPTNAQGMVTGITGSSERKRPFFAGPHRFGVSAKSPDKGRFSESDPYQCMTFAQVQPDGPASPAQTPSGSTPQK